MLERGRKKKKEEENTSQGHMSLMTDLPLCRRARTEVLDAVTAHKTIFTFCHFLNNLVKKENPETCQRDCLLGPAVRWGHIPALPSTSCGANTISSRRRASPLTDGDSYFCPTQRQQ